MRMNPLQWDFTELVAKLLLHMIEEGYHPRLAYALRSKEEATRLGFPNSNHTRYLAVDIDLFDSDGNYLSTAEAHRSFGEWWKAQDPRCAWGGDFSRTAAGKGADGNHYSFEFNGVR